MLRFNVFMICICCVSSPQKGSWLRAQAIYIISARPWHGIVVYSTYAPATVGAAAGGADGGGADAAGTPAGAFPLFAFALTAAVALRRVVSFFPRDAAAAGPFAILAFVGGGADASRLPIGIRMHTPSESTSPSPEPSSRVTASRNARSTVATLASPIEHVGKNRGGEYAAAFSICPDQFGK